MVVVWETVNTSIAAEEAGMLALVAEHVAGVRAHGLGRGKLGCHGSD